MRALVVDDEVMLEELVSVGLRMTGWDVKSAGNGPDALAIARDWKPDVLVLDIMMPGFDGIELLKGLFGLIAVGRRARRRRRTVRK